MRFIADVLTVISCRYHSEVRQEAVQQALAAMQDKPKQVVPLPSKRASVARPVSRHLQGEDHEDMEDEESDIDDDNVDEEHDLICETRNLALGLSDTSSTGSLASGQLPPREVQSSYSNIQSRPMPPLPPSPDQPPPPPLPPAPVINKPLPPSPQSSPQHNVMATYREAENREVRHRETDRSTGRNERSERSDRSERSEGDRVSLMNRDNEQPVERRQNRSSLIETSQPKPETTELQNIEPYDVLFLTKTQSKVPAVSSTPDVALPGPRSSQPLPAPPLPPPARNQRHSANISLASVRANSKVSSSSLNSDIDTGTASRWKVSAKIQQLLDTLRKPKRRPLPEFYEDDDKELELAANNRDPGAPAPEGTSMTPASGPQLDVPAGLPRNLEAAIQRYGSATYKAPVATVLDPNGKLSITLSYGKLLSRSLKIAYNLLNKIGFTNKTGETQVKSGDRIALVYPNADPLNMICAFYGCVMAGTVPVPIEVPISRRDAGSQQIGFLLGKFIFIYFLFPCRPVDMSELMKVLARSVDSVFVFHQTLQTCNSLRTSPRSELCNELLLLDGAVTEFESNIIYMIIQISPLSTILTLTFHSKKSSITSLISHWKGEICPSKVRRISYQYDSGQSISNWFLKLSSLSIC